MGGGFFLCFSGSKAGWSWDWIGRPCAETQDLCARVVGVDLSTVGMYPIEKSGRSSCVALPTRRRVVAQDEKSGSRTASFRQGGIIGKRRIKTSAWGTDQHTGTVPLLKARQDKSDNSLHNACLVWRLLAAKKAVLCCAAAAVQLSLCLVAKESLCRLPLSAALAPRDLATY